VCNYYGAGELWCVNCYELCSVLVCGMACNCVEKVYV
jgi:hypothetical protein